MSLWLKAEPSVVSGVAEYVDLGYSGIS